MLRFILHSNDTTSTNPALDVPIRQDASDRSTNTAIAARDLEMVYRTSQEVQALKSVNLDVLKGDVHMIMGPSGAGKTTLLLLLSGLLTPTRGRIQLLGRDLTTLSRPQLDRFRLKNIGILFQESNLLRSLTALENVETVLKIQGIRENIARRESLELLQAIGLGDRANHLPKQLSGGQQQRVAVARSLAGSPPIIIADEPTASLDSKNGQLVVESMRRLAKEKSCTVLIATHDPRILDLADRVSHLQDGILLNEFAGRA
ncbi:MAG: ABC transporter ATP-binding protein [Elainellaceae cyanobacterium]